MPGRLRYGTSSWSEKSWTGVFYPEGLPAVEWLTHYGTVFDTVEADVTYYRIPDRKMVDGWAARSPDGFLMSAKFPRSIVHGGDDAKPDGERVLVWDHVGEDTSRFLDVMGRLGDKLGPLVLQFPYFNKGAFTGPKPFLERLAGFLDRLPKGPRYAVEVRNKAWIQAPLLALLRERNVALVAVDILYMPHPAELAESLDLVTADFVYARLIGDRKATESASDRFDRVVIDQSARLDRWAKLLLDWMQRVPLGLVYANNHYAGHGPETARDLVARYQALSQ
ncbi:MAG: DUF72 domain-containing protein [Planctomycetota bacterium]